MAEAVVLVPEALSGTVVVVVRGTEARTGTEVMGLRSGRGLVVVETAGEKMGMVALGLAAAEMGSVAVAREVAASVVVEAETAAEGQEGLARGRWA